MDPKREKAQQLARHYLQQGRFLDWFEDLYSSSQGDPTTIPWAHLKANPNLVEWLNRTGLRGEGKQALVVGCGLGDDAQRLSEQGFAVTAFDISPTAIDWCRKRWSDSKVQYTVGDAIHPSPSWRGRFDFILESYTLQSFPPELRQQAAAGIRDCMAPGGTLLVICRGCDADERAEGPPWPLSRDALAMFGRLGLRETSFEDYIDPEDSSVRRFRVSYTL
jgi:SAM-dependent methyltransferase